ncbi:pseudaminic acid synthase [Limisalsivibrio acetivorans]|uniref:pseudaminic acid synthase n=1 Tax=Limisalsivibrio acetivorans TaxID=1304888 RepID=UPI0003B75A38|nr:pseudaminic acid synthase [Limisalsivibrio acetivorans]
MERDKREVRIGGRILDDESPALIIAELSCNHGGDYTVAESTIRAMAEAGADAVKLQTYTPDTITIDCDNDLFTINHGTLWDSRTLYDLYKEAYTPWEWQPKLKKLAGELGMLCFSSPFDFTAVDFLEGMDVPAYKIASFEINDIPLIEYTASKGKPVIISTGIAELEDIELAVETVRSTGNDQIILLKCTSAYPAPVEDAKLSTMADMRKRFGVLTGVSDHTEGHTVPVAAAALGAKVIEKHFIIDRSMGGPDAPFSMEPAKFAEMVRQVRMAEASIGKPDYQLTEKAKGSRAFSRSLFIVEDVKKGELITEKNLRSIRPAGGLHTKHYRELLGKTAAQDIDRGTPASFELFEDEGE